jgi:5-methylcytosine-specific restriction protein B
MEVVPSWTNIPQRKLIQFHPSYSYEDFVQGIKPVKDKVGDVSYELQPGIFQKLCQDYMDYNAINLAVDKSTKVLIIDEINRGNLPKIFGELIYALEYRDEEVDLQYKEFEKGGKNGTLNIPESLKIIGTMNTADRSIVLFDTALRRRFSFIPLFPDYELLAEEFGLGGTLDDGFNNALQNQQLPDDEKHRTLSVLALGAINTKLVGNDSIGREKQIGHTFLLELKEHPENFVKVWKRDIIPLLEEFYFDNPDTLQGLFTVQGSDPKIFTVEKGILDDFTADDLVAALEDYSTWNNE